MLGIGFAIFLLFIVTAGGAFGMGLMGGMMSGGEPEVDMDMAGMLIAIPLLLIWGLAGFIFSLSLMVRRLHDLGKEWFWVFLAFIPVVTFFFSLYLLFFKGEQRANAYGPVPNNSRKIFDVLLGR